MKNKLLILKRSLNSGIKTNFYMMLLSVKVHLYKTNYIMKTKSKKLQLEKITISKLNKNDLMYFRGGSALANCGDQTKDKNNPNCNQSEGGC